jgi:SPP1 family predicted phage head-tail adaptor
MNAGELNQRIVVEASIPTTNAIGDSILEWRPIATIWASKQHKTSREFYAAQKVNAEITDLFIIRYRANVTTRMRVSYNGKHYNILGTDDPNGKRREIHLLCKTEVI